MGLFKKKVSAIVFGSGLASQMAARCTPVEIQDQMEYLGIPEDVTTFELECMYLYQFLVTFSCQAALSDDDSVCRTVLDEFHRSFYASVESEDLPSPREFEAALCERYDAYYRVAHDGNDKLMRYLPYEFVGFLQGSADGFEMTKEDLTTGDCFERWGDTIIRMQMWLGQTLRQMIDSNTAFASKHRLIVP